MALEIETQGGSIFRAMTKPRLNQGLTGVFLASGFHCECFDPALLFSMAKPPAMWP